MVLCVVSVLLQRPIMLVLMLVIVRSALVLVPVLMLPPVSV